jgi:23S rRNA (uracil1939-C5)-methyltransferase
MNESLSSGPITGIASEGQGIVRQEGLVTFIPFTVPGDDIQYQITDHKKNFALGRLQHIIKASPERIPPLCSYYGTCGGCQLQHIQYEAQVTYKRQWIEEALKKIGKFAGITVPAITPANLQWAYRRRINLILKCQKNAYHAGYIANDNKSLVEIESCPIFVEKHDPIIKNVQDLCNKLIPADSTDGKVTILKSDHNYILHFHFKILPGNADKILSDALKSPSIIGILATSQKKSLQFGAIAASCSIQDLSFDFSPTTFIQNHPEQSLNIYKKIATIAKESDAKKILDLYCGIGVSSLLLAKQKRHVKGVELNPLSIKQANANAKKNGLSSFTEFITADVEKVLTQILEKDQPDFIIVNPPREGLSSKVTQTLKSSPAKTLIYISCMPSTLARDLKILGEDKYEIASIEAFDMFPQTVHVETVVVLKAKLVR